MSKPTLITLDRASIEAIAELVADRLSGEQIGGELIDATETARRLGTSVAFVYEHADELGARRLTDSPRSRLRFDPEFIAARRADDRTSPRPEPARRKPAPRRTRPEVELIPVGRKR